MFKLTYQNLELGEIFTEDEDFTKVYKFVENNCLSVNIKSEYHLVFIKKMGLKK
jgi:hypothetical protein